MRLDATLPASNVAAGVVGRDAELARIGELARRLATGRGAVVALLGEPGLGKTTVLEAAIARTSATVENLRTVHVPGRSITHNAIPTIAGVVASAVPLPASPATRLVEKVTRDGTEVSPEDPDVLRAALDIARTAASRRPLLVTVDNLPLSEHGVFPIFTSLAAAASSMPFLLVVTSSSVPPQAQELSTVGSLWIHRLEPLSPSDSVLVVRQAAGRYVPRNVAAAVGTLTRGNPGDMREICALLSEGELHGLDPLPDPLPGTSVSASVYRPWFEALSPEERMLVLCAAIFLPSNPAVLEEATGVPAAQVMGLDGRPLLRQEGRHVAFTDPRLPSAVLAFTSQQDVLHAQEVMERGQGANSVEDAWYRLRSGLALDPDALAPLEDLAHDLLEGGQLLEAGHLARHVREAAPDGTPRGTAALTHGISAYHAGHMGRSIAELSEAVIASPEPTTRYRALVPLVLAMAMRDRLAPVEVADAGIGELAESHPKHAASLSALMARVCAVHLEVDAATRYLERAEQLWSDAGDAPAPASQDVAYEIELTRSLVDGNHDSGDPVPHTSLVGLVKNRAADDVMGWDLAVNEVLLHLRNRRWHRARTALADLRNRIRAYPSDLLAAQTTLLTLGLNLALWEVQAAIEQLDTAEDRYPLHLPFGGTGHGGVARARVLNGQPNAAVEWFERAQHLLLEQPGPPALQVALATEQGLMALTTGDAAGAFRYYSDALSLSNPGSGSLMNLHLGLLVAANLSGDPELIASLPAELADPAGNGDDAVVTALARMTTAGPHDVVRHAREAVDAAQRNLPPGHQAAVLVAAEHALGRLSPEEHAEQVTDLSGATVPAERDEHRTMLLSQARDHFNAAGVIAFTRLVDNRLGALGAHTDSPTAGGRTEPPELTAQEQHIATLVANGASNKQVASTLFVSVRTVELRLTNVYRKLGIRSRRELRELMAQD